MAQIEKSVFISYRRTNIFHARATFQDLRANGYDVFMDYETMNAGDFEQIILNQIKARAHFLVILTPSALERCDELNDWLRREIETAIDTQRNIIPLMFDGFDWNSVQKYLTGKLAILSNYNALKIPAEYFDEAMNRLRTRFLEAEISTVLHPTPKADESAVMRKMAVVVNQPTVTQNQLSASEAFERGNRCYFDGNYTEAVFHYTQSLQLNPHNPTAYYRRGISYSETGKKSLAPADLENATIEANLLIKNNPNDAEAYRALATIYEMQGNPDKALINYTKAIQLNPQYAHAYENRGNVYASKRLYDQALADYDMAIWLNPQFMRTYIGRGDVYTQLGRYDKALNDLNIAIGLSPQSVKAYNNRGWVYFNMGDYDRALDDYHRALAIQPTYKLSIQNIELALKKKRSIKK